MAEVVLYGGPCDGRVEMLRDSYEFEGALVPRDGWPLIIEVRAYSGEKPTEEVFLADQTSSKGRRIARYRRTERVTAECRQVYEFVPDP